MDFYKLTFNSMPEIVFAHKYQTNAYNITLSKKPHNSILEITYVDYGEILFDCEDGNTLRFPEKGVSSNVHRQKMKGTSNGKEHCHITVGIGGVFDIECLDFKAIKNYTQQKNTIIIPQYVLGKDAQKIKDIINKIILYYSFRKNTLKALSEVLNLFGVMTAFCINYAEESKSTAAEKLYCQKAKDYISKNISKKISIADISNELGISEGYLCRIFKSTTGESVIGYINRTKIDIAKDIFAAKNSSVSEAALSLGILDEKYFCRLFKQCTGMTISEYKKTFKF